MATWHVCCISTKYKHTVHVFKREDGTPGTKTLPISSVPVVPAEIDTKETVITDVSISSGEGTEYLT